MMPQLCDSFWIGPPLLLSSGRFKIEAELDDLSVDLLRFLFKSGLLLQFCCCCLGERLVDIKERNIHVHTCTHAFVDLRFVAPSLSLSIAASLFHVVCLTSG